MKRNPKTKKVEKVVKTLEMQNGLGGDFYEASGARRRQAAGPTRPPTAAGSLLSYAKTAANCASIC
ncbi:hypothetical protein [Prevotella dentasini]|uniref:hypothetical protein n=1 Tax=Prevotella dentasini TaxID=589537 RepID=UPI000AD7D558|nr:hypothetical protein [Prevotella dentasini]